MINSALELAVQNNTHVDTVLGHRARYLKSMNREETDPRYKQLAATVYHYPFPSPPCVNVNVPNIV
jgi:hypothetical protein